MSDNTPPTKQELLTLIAEQKAEPDLSGLPYQEQQDFVLDADHPLRAEMRARNKTIIKGMKHHGMSEADLDLD
ncbi:hypothetical protein [Roseibium algae]|uniref:Uncharacterized protein n=1 Tax=Roseibium algae TaxID=3123038 RepID=A0ABU8TFC9_9HYPH